MSELNNWHESNSKKFRIIVIQTFLNKRSVEKSFVQNVVSKNEIFFQCLQFEIWRN